MTISVVIPTYRRVKDLKRCIGALKDQTKRIDEIVVVVRESDQETKVFVEGFIDEDPTLRKAEVEKAGQVEALNAGIKTAEGDIICIIDDDTVPSRDWIDKICENFRSDKKIGGVGGRDRVYKDGAEIKGEVKKVGIITWYGRIVGSHHLGVGEKRRVEHLKGSNMSFRKKALRGLSFDTRLKGQGAEYRNDLALCLDVKRKGWKLIYDPLVTIDHYYASRFDEDQRGEFDKTSVRDLAHNDILVILDHMSGWQRVSCAIYSLLVSSIATPGILQLIRMVILKKGNHLWARFSLGMKGRLEGYKTWKSSKKPK